MPALVRTHARNTRCQPPRMRTGHRAPLAWTDIAAFKKDAGGNRTHFDRVAAGCLAIQLQRHEHPRQESNLIPDLRTVGCIRHTPRTLVPRRGIEPRLAASKTAVLSSTLAGLLRQNIPTWSRTRTWTFGESYAFHYTIGILANRADGWIRTSMKRFTRPLP